MIIESIIWGLFLCSFGGAVIILARKMSQLNTLPQNGSAGFSNQNFIGKIGGTISKINNGFEKQIYLHKFLSWAKCYVLKIETKIDKLLHNIRKKSQKTNKK